MAFLKLNKTEETEELVFKDHNMFLLLTQIAWRAKRTSSYSSLNLKIGEALIGDFESIGLTEQQYRTTKKKLEINGFATFKATNKGTIAKLLDKRVYDINEDENNDQNNTPVTTQQRPSNDPVTTNKNDKKERKKEVESKKVQVRDYVMLTEQELERLKKDYGVYMAKEFIDKLNDYVAERPNKQKEYKTRDHNLTIRKWIRDEIEKKYYEKKVEQLGFSRFYEYFGHELTLKYCNS